ncbi:Imm1 family immunity protein [Catenuloplanes sp. NPDC051500]|uniref:Imm1 family immunity protein n=1 Tax=Catenuloplanes sp. NPDC051500 TaxID=3363959 RepID=UPI00378FD1EB
MTGFQVEPEQLRTGGDAMGLTLPGETARVSVATARRAVGAYLSTGERPGGLEWVPEAG